MRIEMWFDFNKESYQALKYLNNAYKRFKHANMVDILYRSIPQNEVNFPYHEVFQHGRRSGLGYDFLLVIFHVYKNKQDLLASMDQALSNFGIDSEVLKDNLLNHQSLKFVKNQMEHAALQKIIETPTITFSHGFRLVGPCSVETIEQMMIKMYEKDTGIKYCIEEDCER